jgi:hypothetical protein
MQHVVEAGVEKGAASGSQTLVIDFSSQQPQTKTQTKKEKSETDIEHRPLLGQIAGHTNNTSSQRPMPTQRLQRHEPKTRHYNALPVPLRVLSTKTRS